MKNIFFITVLLTSCYYPRNYQKNKPFVFKNTITDIKGAKFSKDEKNTLKLRLLGQLDDSVKAPVKDIVFVLHRLDSPPAYDSGYAGVSARNMRASMLHLGYYKAQVTYTADTAMVGKQQRVSINYNVVTGPPTLIDTITYRLKKPDLEKLALASLKQSFLVENTPVTKANVLGEVSRLVDTFRNNGYYKFTSDDLRVQGDTTIAALTTISDDPFENLRLLAEAERKRDSPTIKLGVILNPVADSLRLRKFYINDVYVYPDYLLSDSLTSKDYTEQVLPNSKYITRYHQKIFRSGLLVRNIYFKKGDVYKYGDYARTINSFSKSGPWQSVNIQIVEKKDSVPKLDMIIQLVPAKKFGFEANVEASYSANANTNTALIGSTGNLFGIATNLSLQNRNIGREGIKMTHAVRAGIELNLDAVKNLNQSINSNELSYTNTISIPRLLSFSKAMNRRRYTSQQSFISTSLAYTDRIALFKLQSIGLAFGYEVSQTTPKSTKTFTLRPINIEYSRLFNPSDSFQKTLDDNPYLRYSFNTALVMGSTFGYNVAKINALHPNRQRAFKVNLEESGYPLLPIPGPIPFIPIPVGPIGLFSKYMRQFGKVDAEYNYLVSFPKNALTPKTFFAARGFLGVGIPLSSKDTSLPFFKQYFAGGPNSMRGWPVRGIGRGGQALTPYDPDRVGTLNDRTGDIRLEFNAEYRYNILTIIPNSLVLRGALFVDVGNVWNFKNTRLDGMPDSLQFSFKNLYKQIGLSAGTGFRLDFNYVLLRFDFGFRFKRPELSEVNAGWKAPSIGFDDLFKKIFSKGPNDEYRRWRYENFNFTIGLGVPF